MAKSTPKCLLLCKMHVVVEVASLRETDEKMEKEINLHIQFNIREATNRDNKLRTLMNIVHNRWPD